MIKTTFADINMWYKDWILILDNLKKSDSYCKYVWRIKDLNTIHNNDSDCIKYFNITLDSLNHQKDYLIKSMWVVNWDENRNCWEEIWIYNKIDWVQYNPQLWDYLVAKINPENSYINDLYLMNDESINEINSFYNNLDLPSCESIIKAKNENSILNNLQENYFIFSIIFILIFIIWIIIWKRLKFKK